MFNRTVITPQTGAKNVTVNEHRAPTDESVRLLREMEAAADAKRTASMQMTGNQFHGVIEFWTSPRDGTVNLRAIFYINGQQLAAEVTEHARAMVTKSTLLRRLQAKIAEIIAHKILVDLFTDFNF